MGFMDWLRRNWPDLLIGVALVAVIAGIIATLISGGTFFPVRRGGTTTPTPQPTTPITGSTTPGTTTPGTTTPSTTTPTTPSTGAQPTDPGASGAQSGAAQDPADPPPSTEGVAVLPPSGAAGSTGTTAAGTPGTTGTTGSTATGTSGGVTALPPAGSTVTTPTTTATPSTTPSTPSTPTVTTPATPASAGSDQASYRVSVGAFGNADNAQRLASQFQSAGYPVLLGSQGNLTIVLVGPYATEAEARNVADQINAGDFGVVDPTVYRYVPDEAAATSTTTTAPAAPATSAATAPAAPATAPATSATGRYLQVGAYANRESSLPQRTRLEGLGFAVTEVQEGELLKLLVGPYQGAALTEAQSRLAANGIENFARGL